jgi:hypothetical protein
VATTLGHDQTSKLVILPPTLLNLEISHWFDDDHLAPDDRGNLQRPPTRLPPDCHTPPVRHQAPI